MIKILLILTVSVLLTLNGLSQNSIPTDSLTCIPNSQLRNALKLIEKGKYTEAQAALLKTSNEVLSSRVELKDSIIATFKQKDVLYQSIGVITDKLISNTEKQGAFKDELIKNLNQDLKRQRRKTVLFAGAGTLVGVGIGFLVNSLKN